MEPFVDKKHNDETFGLVFSTGVNVFSPDGNPDPQISIFVFSIPDTLNARSRNCLGHILPAALRTNW